MAGSDGLTRKERGNLQGQIDTIKGFVTGPAMPPKKTAELGVALGAIVVMILIARANETRESAILWGVIAFALLVHPIWKLPWVEKAAWRRCLALLVWAVLVVVLAGVVLWPEISVYISCDGPTKVFVQSYSNANILSLHSDDAEFPFGVDILHNQTAGTKEWPPNDAFLPNGLPQSTTSYSCTITNRGNTTLNDIVIDFVTLFKSLDGKSGFQKSHRVQMSVLGPNDHFDFFVTNVSAMQAVTTIPEVFSFTEQKGLFRHAAQLKRSLDAASRVMFEFALIFPPTALDISKAPYYIRK